MCLRRAKDVGIVQDAEEWVSVRLGFLSRGSGRSETSKQKQRSWVSDTSQLCVYVWWDVRREMPLRIG